MQSNSLEKMCSIVHNDPFFNANYLECAGNDAKENINMQDWKEN